MRVTDRILQNNFITNLNFSTERLYKAETRVLTNKRINKPSDNPVDALAAMTIRTKLSEIEQYQRNISNTQNSLEAAETAVTELADIFQRLTTLTIQGASDSYGPDDKQSIAGEVNQLLEQVVNLGNYRSESVYVFGGTNNQQPPYQIVRDASGDIIEVTTTGSGGDITGLIGERITIKTNINGEDLFERDVDLFEVLIQVRDHLRTGTSDDLSNDLNTVNAAAEKIYNTQAVIGSRLNRVYAADARAENDVISFTEFLSDAEDIDATEAIMDYQMELLTLQASLQAGARLFQPKLVDFLA